MSTLNLKGVIAPMTTPFFSNGDVDYDAYRQNIEMWNATPLCGYLVHGSNSETPFLDEKEKMSILEQAIKYAAPERMIMVGTGLESVRETIRLTNECAKRGAKTALVLTPHFFDAAMSSESLIGYFTRVADESDIPVLIYNVPKFTHVNIKVDAVARLARHPNIVGMKDSSGDVSQLARLVHVTQDEDFQVLSGTASSWFPGLTLGVNACVLALANCCPDASHAIQAAFDVGNFNKARAIYQIILPVNTAVTATYGISGLKYACELNGYCGGSVRLPLMPLGDSARTDIARIMETARREIVSLDPSLKL